jgi:hypothetical protein
LGDERQQAIPDSADGNPFGIITCRSDAKKQEGISSATGIRKVGK